MRVSFGGAVRAPSLERRSAEVALPPLAAVGPADVSPPSPLEGRSAMCPPLVTGPVAIVVLVGLLVGAQLRPPVTSAGAVLTWISADTGMSPWIAGAIVAAPVWCFAAGGWAAWFLRRWIGMIRAVAVALGVLAAALSLRVLDAGGMLLAGTIVGCLAVAVVATLLPPIGQSISDPRSRGAFQTSWSVALGMGSAAGALLTSYLAATWSWQAAAGVWALLPAFGLVAWCIATGSRSSERLGWGNGIGVVSVVPRRSRALRPAVTAWSLTIHFGLLSGYSFLMMGSLVGILGEVTSVSMADARVLFCVAMVLGVPVAFLLPGWARRRAAYGSGQSVPVVLLVLPSILGTSGLLLAPSWSPWLWVVLIGLGTAGVVMALVLISVRTAAGTPDDTAALSTRVNGAGFLIAGVTVSVVSMLYAVVGSWRWCLVALLVVLCADAVAGWLAGRPVAIRLAERPAAPASSAIDVQEHSDIPTGHSGNDGPMRLALNEMPGESLPPVREAVVRAARDVHLYPSSGAEELTGLLAAHLGVDAGQVVVGAGSVALYEQLLIAICRPDVVDAPPTAVGEVLFPWPTFAAFADMADRVGVPHATVPLIDERIDLDQLLVAITDRTHMVVVVNPNNPTGTVLRGEELTGFLERVPEHVTVVLDEAYREFVDDPDVPNGIELLADRPKIVVLRTFSKAYGLAALRVGYAVCAPSVAAALRAAAIPFAVNRVAQAAAVAALGATDDVLARCAEVNRERTRLSDGLHDAGFSVPESHANFLWLPMADATAFARYCLDSGIAICTPPGSGGARITIGNRVQNDAFLQIATRFTAARGYAP